MWDCVKLFVGCLKGILEKCKMYDGLFKGRGKGEERRDHDGFGRNKYVKMERRGG